MASQRPLFIWVLMALLWMAGIWYLSDQPHLATSLPQDFLLRKIAHVAEYALLTFLWARAVGETWRSWPALVLASVIAVLYAMLDEMHQTWVVGRTGALSDVSIDMVGVILLCLAVRFTQSEARIKN